ncbi:MAG: class I SAM-dependent methyltransferase [Acidobacteria bacterium]|nr:class I SAM-dependent methyltransferase [Acidobacteriota bacterium]
MTSAADAGCPLCQSAAEPRYRIEIPEIGERQVAACRACGFWFVTPRPSAAELERFYSREYFDSEPGGRGFTDYLPKSHARVGEGWLAGRRLRREKERGRVLDVGCGAGDFLAGVRETSGWEAFGTDVSPAAIELARREPGLTLFHGELAAAAFPTDYFDAIFLRNVLEHVSDPAGLMREVWRVLRAPSLRSGQAGGRVWLLIPNGHTELAPFAAAHRRGQAAENVQAHLNFFTPVCFRDWLARLGFRVENIYMLGVKRGLFELGCLPASWRTSRRTRSASEAKPPREAAAWKHTLAYAYLRRALKASFKLPLWLPVGQELHAVARRPAG